MAALLRLEYFLTDAESNQAQTLHQRTRYTGKTKWRSSLQLLLFLTFLLGICYLRIRTEVAPKYQPWVLLGAAGLFFLFHFGLRGSARKQGRQTQLEVTERDLTFTTPTGQSTLLWSAFGELVESPEFFVLINQSQIVIYIIPKRAFPDTARLDWFRHLANQQIAAPASDMASVTTAPPIPPNALALKFQLQFTDYLIRNLSSWRVKGIVLLMYGMIGFVTLKEYLFPDPKAVNDPGTVLIIGFLVMTGIFVFVLFVVALVWWRAERKHNVNNHDLVLTDEGITFLNRTENGFVKWSSYENYLENRWCFIIWNRKTFNFFMFPKRLFPTEADRARCRQLLQTNLKPSRWFYL